MQESTNLQLKYLENLKKTINLPSLLTLSLIALLSQSAKADPVKITIQTDLGNQRSFSGEIYTGNEQRQYILTNSHGFTLRQLGEILQLGGYFAGDPNICYINNEVMIEGVLVIPRYNPRLDRNMNLNERQASFSLDINKIGEYEGNFSLPSENWVTLPADSIAVFGSVSGLLIGTEALDTDNILRGSSGSVIYYVNQESGVSEMIGMLSGYNIINNQSSSLRNGSRRYASGWVFERGGRAVPANFYYITGQEGNSILEIERVSQPFQECGISASITRVIQQVSNIPDPNSEVQQFILDLIYFNSQFQQNRVRAVPSIVSPE